MSEALISSLQKRVDELTAENATLKTEAKERRLKAKALREELDALKTEHTTLTTDRDTYRAKLQAAPSEHQQEIDRLKGALRDRDHRDTFRRVAKAAGVNEGALDDLYNLSGYKPEADEIDETSIKTAITKGLETRPWLKAAPAGAGNETARGSATNPGPGLGRGKPATDEKSDPDAELRRRFPNPGRLA